MKIILIKDVDKLGKRGDIVEVADGYGRNYLIPKNLAKIATDNIVKAYQREKHLEEKRREKKVGELSDITDRLVEEKLTFKVKTGDRDKVFGSITRRDIVERLREKGYTFDRRQILIEEHLKILGEYDVEIDLGEGVKATIKIIVERE
jgi:large subunit ribosomal protein L9